MGIEAISKDVMLLIIYFIEEVIQSCQVVMMHMGDYEMSLKMHENARHAYVH